MEIEQVLSDTKWEILRLLSKENMTPSQLANGTGTTLANMSIQLKLLEALNFVKRKKVKNEKVGRPKTEISLAKEFGYIVIGSRNISGKKLIQLTKYEKAMLSIFFIHDKSIHYYLQKFLFENDFLFSQAISLGFIDSNIDEINLMLLGEIVNYSFKNLMYSHLGIMKKINVLTESYDEFTKKLTNKDQKSIKIKQKVFILVDDKNRLFKLKTKKL